MPSASFQLAFTLALTLVNALPQNTQALTRLTLKEIQTRALEKAPQIREATFLQEAQHQGLLSAKRYPNPTFQAQIGHADLGGAAGETYDVTLEQVIPFPSKRGSQQNLAQIELQLAELNTQEAQLWIQHSVTLAAIHCAHLNEIAKHSVERRRRFKLIQEYLNSHPHASPIQKIEASLIENQIRVLEKGMLETSQERDVAMDSLRAFLQTDEALEVDYPGIRSVHLPDRAILREKLKLKNFDLLKKNSELEKATQNVRLAKRERIPDLAVSLNHRLETSVPQNTFYSAGVALTVPLWDFSQNRIQRAQALQGAASASQQITNIQTDLEFEEKWKKLITAERELALFPLSLIQQAEKKFDQAEAEFRKGPSPSLFFWLPTPRFMKPSIRSTKPSLNSPSPSVAFTSWWVNPFNFNYAQTLDPLRT